MNISNSTFGENDTISSSSSEFFEPDPTNKTDASPLQIIFGVVSFPVSFSFYSAFLGIAILYILLYAHGTTAKFVCLIAKPFLKKHKYELDIQGLSLAILGGKLFIFNFRFSTPDFSLHCVDAVIELRWHLKNIWTPQISVSPSGKQLPFRLTTHMNGMQLCIYNNSKRIDNIEELCKEVQSDEAISADTILNVLSPADHEFHQKTALPFFYKVFPGINITVSRGCIMLGAPNLPNIIQLQFHTANIKHYAEAQHTQMNASLGSNRFAPSRIRSRAQFNRRKMRNVPVPDTDSDPIPRKHTIESSQGLTNSDGKEEYEDRRDHVWYKSITEIELRHVIGKAVPSGDYKPDRSLMVLKNQLEEENIMDDAIDSFQQFFKHMKLSVLEVKEVVDEDVLSRWRHKDEEQKSNAQGLLSSVTGTGIADQILSRRKKSRAGLPPNTNLHLQQKRMPEDESFSHEGDDSTRTSSNRRRTRSSIYHSSLYRSPSSNIESHIEQAEDKSGYNVHEEQTDPTQKVKYAGFEESVIDDSSDEVAENSEEPDILRCAVLHINYVYDVSRELEGALPAQNQAKNRLRSTIREYNGTNPINSGQNQPSTESGNRSSSRPLNSDPIHERFRSGNPDMASSGVEKRALNAVCTSKITIILGCEHSRESTKCTCYDTIVHYGPWMDRVRYDLMRHFFPADFQNAKPFKATQLIPIPTPFMDIDVRFSHDFILRVPYVAPKGSEEAIFSGQANTHPPSSQQKTHKTDTDSAATSQVSSNRKDHPTHNSSAKVQPVLDNTSQKKTEEHLERKNSSPENKSAESSEQDRRLHMRGPIGAAKSANALCEYLDIAASSGSFVHILLPWDLPEDNLDCSIVVTVEFCDARICTSAASGASLIRLPSGMITCELNYPEVWNDLYNWVFKIQLEKPVIQLVREHFPVFSNLIADWTADVSQKPLPIMHFIPIQYSITIEMNQAILLSLVNPDNVVERLDRLEWNDFIIWRIPQVKAKLFAPFTQFQAPSSEITFNFEMRYDNSSQNTQFTSNSRNSTHSIPRKYAPYKVSENPDVASTCQEAENSNPCTVEICLRKSRPHAESMMAAHQNETEKTESKDFIDLIGYEDLIDASLDKSFPVLLTFQNFSLKMNYSYHYKFMPSYTDILQIHISTKDSQWMIAGDTIWCIENFWQNYFGMTRFSVTSSEYYDAGFRNLRSALALRGGFVDEPVNLPQINKFHLFLQWNFDNCQLQIPTVACVNGFETRDANFVHPKYNILIDVQQVTMETRVTDEDMDLTFQCTPLHIEVPHCDEFLNPTAGQDVTVDEAHISSTTESHSSRGKGSTMNMCWGLRLQSINVHMRSLYGLAPDYLNYARFLNTQIGDIQGCLLPLQVHRIFKAVDCFSFTRNRVQEICSPMLFGFLKVNAIHINGVSPPLPESCKISVEIECAHQIMKTHAKRIDSANCSIPGHYTSTILNARMHKRKCMSWKCGWKFALHQPHDVFVIRLYQDLPGNYRRVLGQNVISLSTFELDWSSIFPEESSKHGSNSRERAKKDKDSDFEGDRPQVHHESRFSVRRAQSNSKSNGTNASRYSHWFELEIPTRYRTLLCSFGSIPQIYVDLSLERVSLAETKEPQKEMQESLHRAKNIHSARSDADINVASNLKQSQPQSHAFSQSPSSYSSDYSNKLDSANVYRQEKDNIPLTATISPSMFTTPQRIITKDYGLESDPMDCKSSLPSEKKNSDFSRVRASQSTSASSLHSSATRSIADKIFSIYERGYTLGLTSMHVRVSQVNCTILLPKTALRLCFPRGLQIVQTGSATRLFTAATDIVIPEFSSQILAACTTVTQPTVATAPSALFQKPIDSDSKLRREKSTTHNYGNSPYKRGHTQPVASEVNTDSRSLGIQDPIQKQFTNDNHVDNRMFSGIQEEGPIAVSNADLFSGKWEEVAFIRTKANISIYDVPTREAKSAIFIEETKIAQSTRESQYTFSSSKKAIDKKVMREKQSKNNEWSWVNNYWAIKQLRKQLEFLIEQDKNRAKATNTYWPNPSSLIPSPADIVAAREAKITKAIDSFQQFQNACLTEKIHRPSQDSHNDSLDTRKISLSGENTANLEEDEYFSPDESDNSETTISSINGNSNTNSLQSKLRSVAIFSVQTPRSAISSQGNRTNPYPASLNSSSHRSRSKEIGRKPRDFANSSFTPQQPLTLSNLLRSYRCIPSTAALSSTSKSKSRSRSKSALHGLDNRFRSTNGQNSLPTSEYLRKSYKPPQIVIFQPEVQTSHESPTQKEPLWSTPLPLTDWKTESHEETTHSVDIDRKKCQDETKHPKKQLDHNEKSSNHKVYSLRFPSATSAMITTAASSHIVALIQAFDPVCPMIWDYIDNFEQHCFENIAKSKKNGARADSCSSDSRTNLNESKQSSELASQTKSTLLLNFCAIDFRLLVNHVDAPKRSLVNPIVTQQKPLKSDHRLLLTLLQVHDLFFVGSQLGLLSDIHQERQYQSQLPNIISSQATRVRLCFQAIRLVCMNPRYNDTGIFKHKPDIPHLDFDLLSNPPAKSSNVQFQVQSNAPIIFDSLLEVNLKNINAIMQVEEKSTVEQDKQSLWIQANLGNVQCAICQYAHKLIYYSLIMLINAHKSIEDAILTKKEHMIQQWKLIVIEAIQRQKDIEQSESNKKSSNYEDYQRNIHSSELLQLRNGMMRLSSAGIMNTGRNDHNNWASFYSRGDQSRIKSKLQALSSHIGPDARGFDGLSKLMDKCLVDEGEDCENQWYWTESLYWTQLKLVDLVHQSEHHQSDNDRRGSITSCLNDGVLSSIVNQDINLLCTWSFMLIIRQALFRLPQSLPPQCEIQDLLASKLGDDEGMSTDEISWNIQRQGTSRRPRAFTNQDPYHPTVSMTYNKSSANSNMLSNSQDMSIFVTECINPSPLFKKLNNILTLSDFLQTLQPSRTTNEESDFNDHCTYSWSIKISLSALNAFMMKKLGSYQSRLEENDELNDTLDDDQSVMASLSCLRWQMNMKIDQTSQSESVDSESPNNLYPQSPNIAAKNTDSALILGSKPPKLRASFSFSGSTMHVHVAPETLSAISHIYYTISHFQHELRHTKPQRKTKIRKNSQNEHGINTRVNLSRGNVWGNFSRATGIVRNQGETKFFGAAGPPPLPLSWNASYPMTVQPENRFLKLGPNSIPTGRHRFNTAESKPHDIEEQILQTENTEIHVLASLGSFEVLISSNRIKNDCKDSVDKNCKQDEHEDLAIDDPATKLVFRGLCMAGTTSMSPNTESSVPKSSPNSISKSPANNKRNDANRSAFHSPLNAFKSPKSPGVSSHADSPKVVSKWKSLLLSFNELEVALAASRKAFAFASPLLLFQIGEFSSQLTLQQKENTEYLNDALRINSFHSDGIDPEGLAESIPPHHQTLAQPISKTSLILCIKHLFVDIPLHKPCGIVVNTFVSRWISQIDAIQQTPLREHFQCEPLTESIDPFPHSRFLPIKQTQVNLASPQLNKLMLTARVCDVRFTFQPLSQTKLVYQLDNLDIRTQILLPWALNPPTIGPQFSQVLPPFDANTSSFDEFSDFLKISTSRNTEVGKDKPNPNELPRFSVAKANIRIFQHSIAFFPPQGAQHDHGSSINTNQYDVPQPKADSNLLYQNLPSIRFNASILFPDELACDIASILMQDNRGWFSPHREVIATMPLSPSNFDPRIESMQPIMENSTVLRFLLYIVMDPIKAKLTPTFLENLIRVQSSVWREVVSTNAEYGKLQLHRIATSMRAIRSVRRKKRARSRAAQSKWGLNAIGPFPKFLDQTPTPIEKTKESLDSLDKIDSDDEYSDIVSEKSSFNTIGDKLLVHSAPTTELLEQLEAQTIPDDVSESGTIVVHSYSNSNSSESHFDSESTEHAEWDSAIEEETNEAIYPNLGIFGRGIKSSTASSKNMEVTDNNASLQRFVIEKITFIVPSTAFHIASTNGISLCLFTGPLSINGETHHQLDTDYSLKAEETSADRKSESGESLKEENHADAEANVTKKTFWQLKGSVEKLEVYCVKSSDPTNDTQDQNIPIDQLQTSTNETPGISIAWIQNRSPHEPQNIDPNFVVHQGSNTPQEKTIEMKFVQNDQRHSLFQSNDPISNIQNEKKKLEVASTIELSESAKYQQEGKSELKVGKDYMKVNDRIDAEPAKKFSQHLHIRENIEKLGFMSLSLSIGQEILSESMKSEKRPNNEFNGEKLHLSICDLRIVPYPGLPEALEHIILEFQNAITSGGTIQQLNPLISRAKTRISKSEILPKKLQIRVSIVPINIVLYFPVEPDKSQDIIYRVANLSTSFFAIATKERELFKAIGQVQATTFAIEDPRAASVIQVHQMRPPAKIYQLIYLQPIQHTNDDTTIHLPKFAGILMSIPSINVDLCSNESSLKQGTSLNQSKNCTENEFSTEETMIAIVKIAGPICCISPFGCSLVPHLIHHWSSAQSLSGKKKNRTKSHKQNSKVSLRLILNLGVLELTDMQKCFPNVLEEKELRRNSQDMQSMYDQNAYIAYSAHTLPSGNQAQQWFASLPSIDIVAQHFGPTRGACIRADFCLENWRVSPLGAVLGYRCLNALLSTNEAVPREQFRSQKLSVRIRQRRKRRKNKPKTSNCTPYSCLIAIQPFEIVFLSCSTNAAIPCGLVVPDTVSIFFSTEKHGRVQPWSSERLSQAPNPENIHLVIHSATVNIPKLILELERGNPFGHMEISGIQTSIHNSTELRDDGEPFWTVVFSIKSIGIYTSFRSADRFFTLQNQLKQVISAFDFSDDKPRMETVASKCENSHTAKSSLFVRMRLQELHITLDHIASSTISFLLTRVDARIVASGRSLSHKHNDNSSFSMVVKGGQLLSSNRLELNFLLKPLRFQVLRDYSRLHEYKQQLINLSRNTDLTMEGDFFAQEAETYTQEKSPDSLQLNQFLDEKLAVNHIALDIEGIEVHCSNGWAKVQLLEVEISRLGVKFHDMLPDLPNSDSALQNINQNIGLAGKLFIDDLTVEVSSSTLPFFTDWYTNFTDHLAHQQNVASRTQQTPSKEETQNWEYRQNLSSRLPNISLQSTRPISQSSSDSIFTHLVRSVIEGDIKCILRSGCITILRENIGPMGPCIEVAINSMRMQFRQTWDLSTTTVIRKLYLDFRKCAILRRASKVHFSEVNRKESRGQAILVFPNSILHMSTQELLAPVINYHRQHIHNAMHHEISTRSPPVAVIDYIFHTQFNGAISVSTDVREYTFLRETVGQYIRPIEPTFKTPLRRLSRQFAQGQDKISRRASNQMDSHSPLVVTAQQIRGNIDRQFRLAHDDGFHFQPELNVLGDFTPSIDWVLEKLAMEKETIPANVHAVCSDSLEKVLAVLSLLSNTIEEMAQPWEN